MLSDFMLATANRIIEGGDCSLECYPDGTRFIDAETKFGWATAYYNPVSCEVYDVYVADSLERNHYYRWIHPDVKNEYHKFVIDNNIDNSEWAFTDCETDILVKLEAILNNRKFYIDVVLSFDLEDDVLKKLEDIALERNITFDDLVIEALTKYIESIK
jgi:hypothetical protein